MAAPVRLYARALRRPLPGTGSRGGSESLPDLVVRRAGVRTDVDHLAACARLTGHVLADRLPGLYPHLAAFGPQLQLVCDRRFPFPPLGLVHLSNTVVQHRPLLVSDTYDLEVRVGRLRAHRVGRLVDLETTATVDGQVVWEQTTTALTRGGGGDLQVSETSTLAGVDAPVGQTRWRVPADVGRAFARVSGDVNPIHLSRLTARLFGFPRAIAHGMWTAARALAAVERELPGAYRYDVAFRKPVLLPATVRLGAAPAPGGGLLLGVVSADASRTHLVARLRSLPAAGGRACRGQVYGPAG
ncbi:MAG: hypothetical protein M3Q87_06540 [Actinomycetota bacterium]|nr:hypothetical protein [Actinomycetota bacterium]